MTPTRSIEYLTSLVREFCKLPRETAWLEFKENNTNPQQIGEYISALANAAALHARPSAYLVWGVRDEPHEVVGTTFFPAATKVGNEELESWILHELTPKIGFQFLEVTVDGRRVVLLEIERATRQPVQFQGSSTSAWAPTRRSSRTSPRRSANSGGSSTARPSKRASRSGTSTTPRRCACSTTRATSR